jgi:hypothetical protein
MGFDPEDQEVIRLLTKIKEAEGAYPEHMLVARRRSYLKRMVEINLGIPPEPAIDRAAKDGKPSQISPATSTLVETALVVMIIAEASTMAYFYRDRLADFFRRTSVQPRVQEGTPPPAVETLLEIQEVTPSPALTVTAPSETIWSPPTPTGITVTPTGTPLPGVIPGVVDSISTVTPGEVNLLNATPGPNDSSGNNGNNGNHYGQTPKPERTKENGNNPPPKEEDNDKPPKNKEDKPPKQNEDKPPKENNDKPPKDKNDKPPKT